MAQEMLLDTMIVNSLKNIENSGATGFFRKQVEALVQNAPEFMESIVEAIKSNAKDQARDQIQLFGVEAASVGAKKVKETCQEIQVALLNDDLESVENLLVELERYTEQTALAFKSLI